jgi:predicted aspartyl protease
LQPSSAHALTRILLWVLLVAGCEQNATCDFEPVAQVSLERRGQVFAVPVAIDGQRTDLLLDTGAQRTVLAEAAMPRLKVHRSGQTSTIMIGMNGGSLRSDAEINSMSIGGLAVPVDRVAVNAIGGNTNGVLGLDILRDYDLEVNGPERSLRLYRIQRCADAAPHWDTTAEPVAGVSTRMGRMEVPFDVDGIDGTAVIDTGASFTLIRAPMMRRLGLTEQAMEGDRKIRLHVIAGVDEEARLHRFRSVQIGPIIMHDAPILVVPSNPPALPGGRRQPDGAIGQDVLAKRRMWFSFGTGRLYLSRSD